MRYLLIVFGLFVSIFGNAQSQGVTNAQTKLRPNQLRWSPTDATLDSVYIIRADTSTGEPGWYLVTLSGGGGVQDTTLAGDVVGGLNSTFVRKINGVTVENITPQNSEVLTYNGTQWTPDSIDLADLPTLAQSVLLGRGSASTGVPQAISLGTGLSMSGTTLSNSAPDQTVTISGATGTYPNFTVTPTSPAGSSMQVQYNNAGSFGALDSFTVVANPDRVGIGVPTPTARLDIQGSGATSATNALRVRNSSGTNLLAVANDGLFTVGGSRDLATNSDNVFNFNGSYTLNSGITAYNANSVFSFAPTITSNLATSRPVSFAIRPTWAGTSDSRVALFLSNTGVAASTIGLTSSLSIQNTGTSQTGAYIRMGSSASTIGLSIDQTAIPIQINSVNASGTAIDIQRTGTSNIHTPLRDFQSTAGAIGLPIILQARNTTAGNTSIYSALSLENTSTSSSASALGANAGVGIDFVIQNSAGTSARTATIQAVAPDQSTLSNVIDLRMQTVDNTGTANTTLISKGATGFLGVNTVSPNSTLHASGSVAMAYRGITTLRTLDATDYTIEVTSNTFTVTLPTAVGITGRVYVITNSGSGVTTIATTSSQTFVNVTATPTTLTLNQFGTVTVQSNGANWIRLSSI